MNNEMSNWPTDDQRSNPSRLIPLEYLLPLSERHWRLETHKYPLATMCDYFVDRGGLTEAASKEAQLVYQHEAEIADASLVRRILTRRTAQSLSRLDQVISAILDYLGTWKDVGSLSLSQKVEALREKAGDSTEYDHDEDDWRPLVDKFEENMVDIADIWEPEMASPGCVTLASLAELRFSFVSSYAHALEYMVDRYLGFAAPKLVPEDTTAELCAALGVSPD